MDSSAERSPQQRYRLLAVTAVSPTYPRSEREEAVHEHFRRNGFLYVAVDLKGYRTGSMNEGLAGDGRGLVDDPPDDLL